MGWFSPQHPLAASEQVALERHLFWITRHFNCTLGNAGPFFTVHSPEIKSLNLTEEADLPKLEQFIRECLGFQVAPLTIKVVEDDVDLEAPKYQADDAIFLQKAQLLNLEESVSHLATNLTWAYLNELQRTGAEHAITPEMGLWLGELIPAFRGFGIMMANSTVKSSAVNEGNWESWVQVRYRDVPARVFGSLLAYTVWQNGSLKHSIERELCVDADSAYQKTLKFLAKSDNILIAPGRTQDIFDSRDLRGLSEVLKEKATVRRLAALQRINQLIQEAESKTESGTLSGVPTVISLLKSRDNDIRRTACSVLSFVSDLEPDHLIQVSDLLHDKDWDVRCFALQVLMNHGEKGAVDPDRVLALINDEHPRVAQFAAFAAVRMKIDEPFLGRMLLKLLLRQLRQGNHGMAVQLCGAIEKVIPDVDAQFQEFFDEEYVNFAVSVMREWREVSAAPVVNKSKN